MDVFTHFVVPYLVLMLVGRPQAERLAAGLGGYAPDLDVLTGWMRLVDEHLYFLGHRGLSHSLVGAPIFALAAMALVSLPPWERRFPRMAAWRFTPRLVAIAMVASWTHLALDFTTIWGIPALYPLTLERVSLNVFFYSVFPALVVSGYLCWRLARGTWTDALMRKGAVALAVVFVAAGGVRLATYPDVPAGGLAQPGPWEWEWTTFEPQEGGVAVTWWSLGRPVASSFYNETIPEDPGAREALAAAEASLAYRAFALYASGPEVVRVEPAEGGAWNVMFVDLLRRAQADNSDRFPDREERGVLRLVVEGSRVREHAPE